MARPIKKGLDYFPFNVDFFDDDKIAFVSARFQEKGELIAIKLLCKIYKDGYFYQWGEDEAVLFAKRVVGDASRHTLVNDVVQELIKRDFFDKDIFDRFKILTSRGIQSRYLQAISERKEVEIISEFWLTELPKSGIKIVNRSINEVNPPINQVNPPTSTQSKLKETKVKRSKGEEEPPPILEIQKPSPKKRIQPDALQFPFSSEKFIEVWTKLVQMPKWKKKLPLSLQMSLDKLAKYDEDFTIELIKRAIEGDYQGVTFDDTDDKFIKWKAKHSKPNQVLQPTDDRKQSLLKKFEANAN